MVEKVENPSSAPDFVTSPELEEGIVNSNITTFTITKEVLPYYLKAASKTNFEVTVIAKPGEYYLTGKAILSRRRNPNGQVTITSTTTAEKSQNPVREGSVAISLKRPNGVKYDTVFHTERQKIQPI